MLFAGFTVRRMVRQQDMTEPQSALQHLDPTCARKPKSLNFSVVSQLLRDPLGKTEQAADKPYKQLISMDLYKNINPMINSVACSVPERAI
jgi:hypothetical protein